MPYAMLAGPEGTFVLGPVAIVCACLMHNPPPPPLPFPTCKPAICPLSSVCVTEIRLKMSQQD